MRRAILICALALLAAPVTALARPGDLDPRFSRDGFAPIRLPTERAIPTSLEVDRSDRVVVAGFVFRSSQQNSKLLVTRVLRNGRADPSFGRRGKALIELGGPLTVSGSSIDSQGRIIVVGTLRGELFVARLLDDGRLDRDFAVDGVFRIETKVGYSGGYDVVVAGDDGVFAIGKLSAEASEEDERLLTLRLDADGRPLGDPAGERWNYVPGEPASGLAAIRTESGAVLVAGESGTQLGLARFGPAGDLDPSFGDSGFAVFDRSAQSDPQYSVSDLALDSVGRVVVTANECFYGRYTTCRPAVARITNDGLLDLGFDRDGWWAAFKYGLLTGVAVQRDGAIVLSDTLGPSGTGYVRNDFAVLRLRPNGALDPSFSDDGLARIDFGFATEQSVGVELQANGDIIVAGETDGPIDYYNEDFLVARYQAGPGRANADADTRLDADDACPERYGTGNSGCPWIRRFVVVRPAGESGVRISVNSKADACRRSRIRVLRSVEGQDKEIASGWTTEYGNYRAQVSGSLQGIYAVARRRVVREFGVCRGARSAPLAPTTPR